MNTSTQFCKAFLSVSVSITVKSLSEAENVPVHLLQTILGHQGFHAVRLGLVLQCHLVRLVVLSHPALLRGLLIQVVRQLQVYKINSLVVGESWVNHGPIDNITMRKLYKEGWMRVTSSNCVLQANTRWQLESQSHLPIAPVGPGGPLSPAPPLCPGDPRGPSSPLSPGPPGKPGAPGGPLGPRGPASPAGPCSPCSPLSPRDPAGPVEPRPPVVPATPEGPGGPRAPRGPESKMIRCDGFIAIMDVLFCLKKGKSITFSNTCTQT